MMGKWLQVVTSPKSEELCPMGRCITYIGHLQGFTIKPMTETAHCGSLCVIISHTCVRPHVVSMAVQPAFIESTDGEYFTYYSHIPPHIPPYSLFLQDVAWSGLKWLEVATQLFPSSKGFNCKHNIQYSNHRSYLETLPFSSDLYSLGLFDALKQSNVMRSVAYAVLCASEAFARQLTINGRM